MTGLFAISLTSTLLVVMLYPVFHIMVSRCRAFNFNRLVLLIGMTIIVLMPIGLNYLPLYNLTIPEIDLTTGQIHAGSQDIKSALISQITAKSTHYDFLFWILCLYWCGIALLLFRQIYSYIQLSRIISRSEKQEMDEYILCKHDSRDIAPFSWGRFIVFPYDENEPSILLHEMAHTSKRHWIDIVFADFICIFMWYNPFVWLLKNLVKLNHEYEADAVVIGADIDILSYQKLLIAKAAGNRSLHIANNFAMSKKNFRRRILTMNQPKSSKEIKWIAATIVPALAMSTYAYTTPWSVAIHDAISNYKFTSASQPISEVVEDNSKEKEPHKLPATLITKRLPSPLTNPEPLLKQFEMSLELADKDLIPDKILVRIEADEDGNIVSATSDHDDNPEVRVAIDRATNQIAFEVVKDGDRKVSTRFAIPIRKEGLPM